jgi:hypothetical protein
MASPKNIFGDSKGYLSSNEEWQVSVSRVPTLISFKSEDRGWLPELKAIVKKYDPGVIAVKYQDVHKRYWATYLRLERNVDLPEYVMEGEQDIMEVD